MKKRSAEKIISRSILALATYRKSTMGRALRRRPRFWTVAKEVPVLGMRRVSKRLRVEFEGQLGTSQFTLTDDRVPGSDGDAALA